MGNIFFYLRKNFWLVLSIVCGILFSLGGLKLGLSSPYIIQDDARQHIFWMQKFSNPNLYRDDLIADYFKSVSPWGFTNLYKLVSSLGIDVLWFNKVSPLLIGIGTSIFCFLVSVEIFGIPVGGFISSLLLNQNLWMVDDLSSGTPRGFIYLFFLAFIYYLLRGNLWCCLFSLILQGLFYPQVLLISTKILLLRFLFFYFQNEYPKKNGILKGFSSFYRKNKIIVLGLFSSISILAIYKFKTSNFGDVITASEAKLLPEFAVNSRSEFFVDSFWQYWLFGRRSGFLPIEWQYILMCFSIIVFIGVFPRKKLYYLFNKNNNSRILLEIFIASCFLFCLAHLFLFRLHLPGRYTQHTIRILIALLTGISVGKAIESLFLFLKNKFNFPNKILQSLGFIICILLLLFPSYAVQSYPHRLGYVTGKAESLYKFLERQPENSLVATLSKEGDFIPTFAKRSVLVSEEYAIPYHKKYYQQIRQRTKNLIQAQYTIDRATLVKFIEKYNIDFWLLDKDAFTIEYLKKNNYLMQFSPEVDEAIFIMESDRENILLNKKNSCTVLDSKDYRLLSVNCILNK